MDKDPFKLIQRILRDIDGTVKSAIEEALRPLDPRYVELQLLYRFNVERREERLDEALGRVIDEALRGDDILVIGVGNPLFGDDGVGYCIVEAATRCGGLGTRVMTVTSLDPGLAGYFEGRRFVVIVDAVDPRSLPDKALVAIYELDPSKMRVDEAAEAISEVSSHDPNPVNLALLAYAGGFRGKVYIVGVRVERVELGERLSNTARRASLRALDELLRLLEKLGAKPAVDKLCFERSLSEVCGSG